MKYRESGMPAQDYWETLLDIEGVLDAFAIDSATGEVAELGCGYGTFTIPVARRTAAMVHAYEIDPVMIETTRARAVAGSLANIRTELRDVFADGFGLSDGTCGACLLFNILHGESPVAMLREATRVVRPGGTIAVLHWRSDIRTPRGPNADIRPRPEQIVSWSSDAGQLEVVSAPLILPPWHYGVRMRKDAPGGLIADRKRDDDFSITGSV